MKKVFLTGANGFIGRHTIPFLLESGYEIHAITSRNYRNFSNNYYNEKITWHTCDLLDLNEQRELIKNIKPTHLLHFAWYTNSYDYLNSLENIKWFEASLNLLQCFEMYGGVRAVFAGSCIENTSSPYAICKTNLKNALFNINEYVYNRLNIHFDLKIAWGRIFYPYGIYDRKERLIPYVINCLLQNKNVLCTDGEQLRDLLYVEDIANAFVLLLDSSICGEFDISSGKETKLKDVIEFLGKKLDKEYLIRIGALRYRDNEIMRIVGYPDCLYNKLKWKPKYSLNNGLDKTIEWCKNNID